MPTELQIIHANEFIRVGAEGNFNMEASRRLLAQIAGACRKRGIGRALIDLRALQPKPVPVFSPANLATLISTFHEIGFSPGDRLALLYSADPHYRARMFAFIGKLKGWQVQAFDNFEKALTWLSDSETLRGDARGDWQSVPITTARQRRNRPRRLRLRSAGVRGRAAARPC